MVSLPVNSLVNIIHFSEVLGKGRHDGTTP